MYEQVRVEIERAMQYLNNRRGGELLRGIIEKTKEACRRLREESTVSIEKLIEPVTI